MPENGQRPIRIVIVGGGFAGAYCARRLERLTRGRHVELTLINRTNYFLFTPLLVEAGTGTLEPRHTVVSLRSFVRRARFIMGDVVGIDFARREVSVRATGADSPAPLAYDELVLAIGAVSSTPPVPGLKEFGFEMKNLADGIALRDRLVQMLEAAEAANERELKRRFLHFVVVGGNYTGVETAGEFEAMLSSARRSYPSIQADDIRITLIEITRRILPTIDESLARFAADRLKRRGIEIRLGDSIDGIERDAARLRSGETLATRTVIWCAGIAPSPLVGQIGVPVNEKGYMLADTAGRVQGMEHVWAIGDCAVNPDPRGGSYPPTAQHATRLGEALAANLVRIMGGREAEPIRLKNLGALAALGHRSAVADVMGLKFSGFIAWFLWRTVYLMKMPGWGRTIRVMLDWTLDLFLPRDRVQLGLYRQDRK